MNRASANDQSQLLSAYLPQLHLAGYGGDVDTSESTRVVGAVDNSIYQQQPSAVLFPATTEDVQRILRVANRPKYSSLTFTPRGGGTGTNGQSLTAGVVVDVSRHMTRILELDVENRRVRVQAGVVKDALNDYLRPHGLFFSPDLSTSNRAVIGGMISTDASGQGSLRYGKTSDRTLGLRCILSDGELMDTSVMSLEEATDRATGEGIEARVISRLIETHALHGAEIDARFPALNRFLTGYDLKHALQDGQLDLTRLVCGAEGTLCFITEAWLDLDVIPASRILVNINYDSFDSALRSAPAMLDAEALSVETVDSTVLSLAKADVVWDEVADDIDDASNPDIKGLNLVEFAEDTAVVGDAKVRNLCDTLDRLKATPGSGVLGYKVCNDLASIQRVYGMRKKSVGLLANLDGDARPVAFVEDTCVPPEHLADYIARFRALLDEKGLRYGMFGHVDCGVLHVRPALDLTDPPQRQLVRQLSDEVAALTAHYGGLFWGEHGRGFRSEYGPVYFGETLFAELRKIKAAFDPHNRLNPGKICTPWGEYADGPKHSLVSVDGPLRGVYDEQIPSGQRAAFAGAMACNGNGLCFNYDTASTMCPSFKATGDRRHSPKGRATLLREWLRKQATGEQSTAFDGEVADALRGCLACKACSSACPVKVDIPNYRSRFLDTYHQRHRRPLKDYLVGGVEYYTPWMAKLPKLSNALSLNALSRRVIPRLTGMSDLPALSAKESLNGVVRLNQIDALKRMSGEQRERCVCLVPDAFTLFYEAELVADWMRLVEALGYQPVLLPYQANGKPAHVKGFLKMFRRVASATVNSLNEVARLGIPMVGLDPAMTLCYRDEYTQVLGEERGVFKVLLPQEWLLSLDVLPNVSASMSNKPFRLLNHCTERALVSSCDQQWREVFEAFGLVLATPASGCCGMCGSYGHETAFLDTSRKIYDLDWADKVADSVEEVLATGYSCRSQVKRFGGKHLRHPIQPLLAALKPSQARITPLP